MRFNLSIKGDYVVLEYSIGDKNIGTYKAHVDDIAEYIIDAQIED